MRYSGTDSPILSHDEGDQMILRFLRADGRKLTTHTVNSFTELLYIVVGFQKLGYLGITGKMGVADRFTR